MPNFGAGVDAHVNPGVTPTWVFTPSPVVAVGALSTVRLYNEGTNPVYVGGANVSQFNGLQIQDGSKPLELINAGQTLYACSGVQPTATGATLSAAVLPAGATAFTVSASIATIPVGSVLLIGKGGSQEVGVIAGNGGATTTTFTLSTATLYDHAASSPLTVATMLPAQLRVTAGMV